MFKTRRDRSLIVGLMVTGIVAVLAVLGCQGGDTDGGIASGDSGLGSQFVADGGAGAKLEIEAPDTISTGDTDHYFVVATDPRGAPLDFVRIFLESEHGLAIIEPSANGAAFEHTGADGRMSGRIGCITPGSYILEARAPDGYGLLTRKTIKCVGDVPEGFAGFPGAAGGNLGGGLLVDETPDDQRIVSILYSDAGGSTQFGPVDTIQDDCDLCPTAVLPEPFTDILYTITVKNVSLKRIFIDTVTVDVQDGQAASDVTQAVTVEIEPGGTGEVSGILVQADSLTYAKTGGSPVILSGTFTVGLVAAGEDEDGDSILLTDESTLTFRNVGNCTAVTNSCSSSSSSSS